MRMVSEVLTSTDYEVKVKGQAYSQAKVISALSAILDIDVPKEMEWLETKIPRDKSGKITDS